MSTSLAPILLLALLGSTGTSVIVTETLLDDDPASDGGARVSGSRTVFFTERAGNRDVYFHDGVLTPFAATQDREDGPDIDGTAVVYWREELGTRNLWLGDALGGSPQRLTSVAEEDWAPAISGDTIVFLRGTTFDEDVWAFDIPSRTATLVAAPAGTAGGPAIDGDLLVWLEHVSGSTFLRAAELGGGAFTVDIPFNTNAPSVSGDLIAYIASWDVMLYDHGTGETTQITDDLHRQTDVHVHGRHLVWVDDRNGNLDLFLHDLDDGRTYPLTSDPSDQHLGDLDENVVVFVDQRLGDTNVWRLDYRINHFPTAEPGPDLNVGTGDLVQLDGAGSDPDGDPIVAWAWELEARPMGSVAALSDPSSQAPSFVADVTGDYVVTLAVNDGTDWSEPSTLRVYAFGAETFCDGGDDALASCPCSNPGHPRSGCDLAYGGGGVRLVLSGQETAPENRATWRGTGFPTHRRPAALVIRATGLDAATPVPFGDGLRCIGSPMVRMAAAFAIDGSSTHVHGHHPAAGPGDFYYQLWFRNAPVMYCDPSAGFNLSNGWTLAW